ncbi:hypothetical protein DAKH74_046610 [Maudiozyma humilis]|uniref:Uncharacterized protein n=1 Tax=Maudiozyma humilis TaxID=51915 RepID=A0AAV5S2G3_MAUHU|nr:hypothetical protein DAKH74_046610 [Kazachstania humilis]
MIAISITTLTDNFFSPFASAFLVYNRVVKFTRATQVYLGNIILSYLAFLLHILLFGQDDEEGYDDGLNSPFVTTMNAAEHGYSVSIFSSNGPAVNGFQNPIQIATENSEEAVALEEIFWDTTATVLQDAIDEVPTPADLPSPATFTIQDTGYKARQTKPIHKHVPFVLSRDPDEAREELFLQAMEIIRIRDQEY